MGKNKEEFMKDREQKMTEREEEIWNQGARLLSAEIKMKTDYMLELEEVKHLNNHHLYLLYKSKTLIADMVMYNLDKDMYNRYDDVMKQAQELLTELKEY